MHGEMGVVKDTHLTKRSIVADHSPCIQSTLKNIPMRICFHVEMRPRGLADTFFAHMNFQLLGGESFIDTSIDKPSNRVKAFHMKTDEEAVKLSKYDIHSFERQTETFIKVVVDDKYCLKA